MIERRIRNLLDQAYPPSSREVIVVSDGSTDRTAEVTESFQRDDVRVVRLPKSCGRAGALDAGRRVARGDIILHTDAMTLFEPGYLGAVATAFHNPSVGCAVGRLIYQPAGETAVGNAEAGYFSWEARLRAAESTLGIFVVGTGATLAFRRVIQQTDLRYDEDPDAVIPLRSALLGYTNRFLVDAVARDVPPSNVREELRYRIRDVSISLASTVNTLRGFGFQIFARPLVLWSLASHRILRWATPLFLMGMLFSTAVGAMTFPFMKIAFGLQVLGWVTICVYPWLHRFTGLHVRLVASAYVFSVANLGILAGLGRYALGRTTSRWG